MRYPTLLLDLDHTLLDSDASETAAFHHTLVSAGIEDPAAHFETYRRINRPLWAAVERGEMAPDEVRILRFERLATSLRIDADPQVMADAFVAGLGANGDLYPGAREVLDELETAAQLALVTNGIGEVQRTRIERLDLARYMDAIVISGEVGTSKPGTRIFDLAFEALGAPRKRDTLMVGDSLTSDMRGGADYGIDTCWFNRHGINGVPATVTHVIHDLVDLPRVAAGVSAS